jgi:hypothetical protein
MKRQSDLEAGAHRAPSPMADWGKGAMGAEAQAPPPPQPSPIEGEGKCYRTDVATYLPLREG